MHSDQGDAKLLAGNNSGGPLRIDAQTPPGNLKPYALTRTPLSAQRPNLGCSLPSLSNIFEKA